MTHLLETTMKSWSDIEKINVVKEVHEAIWQTEEEIAQLAKEPASLTSV